MRRHLFQDFSLPSQPRDRSRPLAELLAEEGIGAGRAGRRRRLEDLRPRRDERRAGLPRRRAARAGRAEPGPSRTPTDLLIDAGDGLRVINEVEQLAAFEWASCQTSQGVRRLLRGLRPGMTRARGGRAARLERLAAVVPPHADRRAARHATGCSARATARSSAAIGSRPPSASGARSPAARASSSSPRTSCPSRIRDYVDRLVAPYFAAIAEWYGAHAHRRDRRRRSTTSSTAASATRSSASSSTRGTSSTSTSGSTRRSRPARRSSCAPGWRSRSTSSRRPGPSTSRRTSRTASPWPTRRCAPPSRERYPDAWARIQARRRFMARPARHRAPPRRPAVLEHAGPPAAVPPSPGPCHDPRRMSRPAELVLRSDELEVVILPELGGRIHRLRAFGTDLLRTPPDPAAPCG